MNEQQLDAPGPRREVAPSEARAIICISTDQTAETLIAMLQEVSRVSRDNDHRLMDLVNGLTQQLQAAEDRIGLLEARVEHFRGRAIRAESWLERVLQEIEQTLIGPMTARQT
jgi:hypothetical protein